MLEQEAKKRFIAIAKQSLEEFKKNGNHITREEFSQWVKAKKSNHKSPIPAPHG